MNDNELIYYIKLGNQLALEQLLDNYKKMLYSIVNKYRPASMHSDYEDAYDIALNAFNEAIQSYREDQKTTFSTYLYRCVECRIINYVNSKYKNKNLMIENSYSYEESERFVNEIMKDDSILYILEPSRLYKRKEAITLFNEYIDTLKDSDKEMMELFLSGMSSKEISERFNTQPRKVTNRIRIIRNKAIKRLEYYENN